MRPVIGSISPLSVIVCVTVVLAPAIRGSFGSTLYVSPVIGSRILYRYNVFGAMSRIRPVSASRSTVLTSTSSGRPRSSFFVRMKMRMMTNRPVFGSTLPTFV
uniref:Putative secreted protein n=1 Tax=Anopheles darlingi TaxID=43151 RepID=A0A2M4DHP9_ANODA